MHSALARSEPVSGVVRAHADVADHKAGLMAKLGLIVLRTKMMNAFGEYVVVEREMYRDGKPIGTQFSLGIIDVGEPLLVDLSAKAVILRTGIYASLVDAPDAPDTAATFARNISFRTPELLHGLLAGFLGWAGITLPWEERGGQQSRCRIIVGEAEIAGWSRESPLRGAVLLTLEEALFERLSRL